ncbi:zinc finger protein-like isoform X2 [Zophobas morio]|uniref:zinc finger protein-like isoform X2 n=1 Tax=Zophobas morio TaxID=2755281 RepID=UPI0030831687
MSGRQSCYAAFFSEFSARAENKILSFSEKARKAGAEWRSMDVTEKQKYKSPPFADTTDFVHLLPKDESLELVKLLVCANCGRTFKESFRLRYHLSKCGEVKCDLCDKILKNEDTLKKHVRFVHSKEKLFNCPTCEKGFSCRADLRAHYNIHRGVRFTCDTCNQTFSNTSNLARHCKKYVH